MLVAAGIITLMYIPVFLTIRGNLLITPSQSDWCGYRIKFRSDPAPITSESTLSGGSSSQTTHVRGIAKKMLWYPIVYMTVLLPTVVCRFKGIYGSPVPLPVILGCISLLSAMGISNVGIYLFTRNLGGTPWFARPLLSRQTDVEILVERTTINEAGSALRGDNDRVRDSTRSLPTALHLDAIRIPPHFGEDLFPDIGAKAKGDEVDEVPTPTSKVSTSSQVGASESDSVVSMFCSTTLSSNTVLPRRSIHRILNVRESRRKAFVNKHSQKSIQDLFHGKRSL